MAYKLAHELFPVSFIVKVLTKDARLERNNSVNKAVTRTPQAFSP